MTTLNRYRGVQDILRQIDSVRGRRRIMRLATGVVAVLTILLAAALIALPAAGYWPGQPPVLLRWALLGGIVLAAAGAVAWFLVRPLLWKQTPAETARFIEQHIPDLHNDLINSVLLSEDRDQVSPELVQQAIHEASRRSRRFNVHQSVSTTPLQRWGIALGAAALLLAGMGVLQAGPMQRGFKAIFSPTEYVAQQGEVRILSVEPGDATRFSGEQVNVIASVRNPDARDLDAEILVEDGEARPMVGDINQVNFSGSLGRLEQDVNYAVRIGDTRWPLDRPYYTVTVLKRVEVDGLDLEYAYPPYTGLEDKVVTNAEGGIEAPMGSTVTVRLRLSAPVPSVVLEYRGGGTEMLKASPDDREFTAAIDVHEDSAYRLIVRDSRGNTLQQLPDLGSTDGGVNQYSAAGRAMMSGYYRIHSIPDAPPRVEFTEPGRDVTLPPGDELRMGIKAYDKYALSELRMAAEIEGADRRIADESFDVTGKSETVVEHDFSIPATYPDDGSVTIVYYAIARDNRNLAKLGGPQTAVSPKYKITVQNADRLAEEKAKRYDELRNLLMDILERQEHAKVETMISAKDYPRLLTAREGGEDAAASLAKVAARVTNVGVAQRDIRSGMIDVVDNFPFDPEMTTIQQALALLANNEAQLAIDQAQVVVDTVKAGEPRGGGFEAIGGTQDKIIDTLQTLLAIMPSLANRTKDRDPATESDNIPPEEQERIAELHRGLEEFIEAARKSVKAGERLAKKPVDNFTPEDEELLKDLEAGMTDWEKFINEKFTDFSKLAQQDFSNPVTMKELISVKSDITMAKDALSNKSQEIATALEDNAIEQAESLTANIEKWLPDKPDREAWKMEEPAGQENVEAPELPDELEDLVGDLLEEEEDLFEEMDDITSKYTMSGDQGIGWDALDGPISSMNAQGVTGNHLPNTNELAGRSGEGRQGKSSGEFVEDKAVGKGGRRTPTRLTPEPFQKGQINDVSEEQAGGSTGGGKMGGPGEEGLEGPVPPPLKKDLGRLEGKQATLMQKFNRLRENFQASDYTNFKMLQGIILMDRVRDDLANYRYQNALRRKDETLDALRQARIHAAGGIEVETDTTAHMPKYIRDDIADAMKGKMPAEYRDVLEQYYRRLSERSGG